MHFGRLLGVVGFAKTVAIKRLHPQLARDPEFVSMFLDEARLAARIRHPNVVSTLDVVALDKELFLVMEYVQGESLRHLERAAAAQGGRIPPPVAATIVVGMLHGLHAAHEAANERGEPLGIVHRDVSPQNVMVGIDGVPRVFDFGVAKAAGRAQTTREGQLKGKLAYMAPEQLMGRDLTRAADIFAASAVLWEALVGKRLFKGDSEGEVIMKVLDARVDPPSKLVPELPPQLDDIVLRGLARRPEDRFATAREMARALEKCVNLAPTSEVGEFVEKMAASTLAQRAERVAKIESSSTSHARLDPLTGAPPRAGSVPGGSVDSDGAARFSGSMRTAVLTPPSAGEPAPSELSTSLGAVVTSPKVSRPLEHVALHRLRRQGALRRVVAGAVVAACAVLLVALGASLHGRPEAPAHAAVVAAAPVAAPPVAAAPVAAPPVAVPPVAAGPAVEPATALPSGALAEPLPAAPPPGAVEPSVDPGAAVASAPGPRGRAAASAPRPASRRPAASCDPPYTVDASGFRHYKRECVQ